MCPVPTVRYSYPNVQMALCLHFACVASHLCIHHPYGMCTTSPFAAVPEPNNICEGWNNAFSNLVGHAHPTIWRAIDTIRKDQAQVATALLRDQHGEPPVKRTRRHTVQLQTKLHNLCTARRDGTKSIPDTLRGIGHCVRWK